MGLLDKLFGNNKEKRQEAQQIIDIIKAKTTQETVLLRPVEEEATPYNSKIGGVPYLPVDFSWPMAETEERTEEGEENAEGGVAPVVEKKEQPLRFLAQINFEEMPPLPDFPTKGILQFYIAADDGYGMNYEELTLQKAFRIVYHPEVNRDQPLRTDLPFVADMEDAFPVSGEALLKFEPAKMAVAPGDFRFDHLLLRVYNEVQGNTEEVKLEEIPERVIDEVYDALNANGCHVGGYPAFTQMDPREYYVDFREHTVLLLQLDSVEMGDFEMMWGDSGVCHFFIRKEDLARLDFSDVVYSWDCY